MKYFYILLDYILISTIKIPFLSMCEFPNANAPKRMKLCVYLQMYNGKILNNASVIDFKCNLTYVIYNNDNLIEAYTDNIEKVISSFFNIPLALFLERDNALILHASSIEIDGNVFAFSGNKGMGKSTLTFLLSQYYNFYADDTLVIKYEQKQMKLMRVTSYIRLCNDTYKNITQLDNFDDYLHNVMGKAYVSPADTNFKNSSVDIGRLKSIFFLERASGPDFELHLMEAPIIKYLNIVNNIVGIDQMKSELLFEEHTKELLETIVGQVRMYKLAVPYNFDYVKESFIKFIKNVLER